MPDESKYNLIDITTAESRALKRLSSNKDFEVFAEVMLRYHVKSGIDLLSSPHPTQDVTTIEHQGAYKFYRRILKYVYGED